MPLDATSFQGNNCDRFGGDKTGNGKKIDGVQESGKKPLSKEVSQGITIQYKVLHPFEPSAASCPSIFMPSSMASTHLSVFRDVRVYKKIVYR